MGERLPCTEEARGSSPLISMVNSQCQFEVSLICQSVRTEFEYGIWQTMERLRPVWLCQAGLFVTEWVGGVDSWRLDLVKGPNARG